MAYSRRMDPGFAWRDAEADGPAMAPRAGMAVSGTTRVILLGQGSMTLTGADATTLLFADSTLQNVTLTRSGDDLCILYGIGEAVTVTGQFVGTGVWDIGFAGGLTIAANDLAQLVLLGTDGDETLTGVAADWSADDVIHGLAGRDAIADSDGGSNLIDGGDGDDDLGYTELGHSTVLGGAGNDFICIAFSANPDQPETPVAGTALIVGGAGDDTLRGGAGDDVYRFGLGDGDDFVGDLGGTDRFQFGPGITLADVTFTKQNTMLWIRVRDPANPDAAQGILVERWFGADVNRCIESFAFDDGTVLDAAQVTTLANIMRGTAQYDFLYTDDDIWWVEALGGGDIIDYLPRVPMYVDAGSGNDTIAGAQIRAQEATVVGGLGNDSITGTLGREIYLFDRGDGNDTIRDGSGERSTDRLVFGAGVARADVVFGRDGLDLMIRIGGDEGAPADSIRVVRWFWQTSAFIESVTFADGSALTMAQITELGNFIVGTDGNDSINPGDYTHFIDGRGGNDTIDGGMKVPVLRGGDGNDILRFSGATNSTVEGGNGNDTLSGGYSSATGTTLLTGGPGDDHLVGSLGTTNYAFNRGDGRDTVTDYGNTSYVDRLIFGAGIVQADVSFARSQNDLVLTIGGAGAAPAGDAITVIDWYGSSTRIIEQLRFADGTVLTAAQVGGMVSGTAGADTLTATPDQFLLSGLAGDDRLAAGTSGVLLAGGAGNDTLTGGAAADFLQGGKGDDLISAGLRDVVAFNAGDGADTLKAVGNGATLSLGAGIGVAQLTLSHAGADLVLGLGGTDAVTLKDWYAATQPAQGITRLQTVGADGVHLYDFRAAAMAFDSSHGPGSGAWAIETELSAAGQGSVAGTALGGVLAVDIAAHGTVTLLSPVYDTLRAGLFGLDPQPV